MKKKAARPPAPNKAAKKKTASKKKTVKKAKAAVKAKAVQARATVKAKALKAHAPGEVRQETESPGREPVNHASMSHDPSSIDPTSDELASTELSAESANLELVPDGLVSQEPANDVEEDLRLGREFMGKYRETFRALAK